MQHGNNETIPEMTPDTQRTWTPLKEISGGEMGEKEKQEDVGTMKRSRTEDLRVIRNRLMRVAGDATWDPGEVLAYDATRGHIGVLVPEAQGSITARQMIWFGLSLEDLFISADCAELAFPISWASRKSWP